MSTSQDNALEQALEHTTGDDWIAGAARDDGASPVTLQHWERQDGGSAIPFFTSMAALESAVAGPAAFRRTTGAHIVRHDRRGRAVSQSQTTLRQVLRSG